MKRTMICLSVIFGVLVCTAATSCAYTFTVVNKVQAVSNYNTAIPMSVRVHWSGGVGNAHWFPNTYYGQTASYSNGDWKTAGLCWERIEFGLYYDVLDCPHVDSLKTIEFGLLCRDVTLTLIPDGRCGVGATW